MAELFDSYVKLLLHFDGADAAQTDIDYSGFNHIPTFVTTAALDTAQKKFGLSSLLVDGNSDYVWIPDSPYWYFQKLFTIDFRVRFNVITSGVWYGLCAQYEAAVADRSFQMFRHTDNTLRFNYIYNGLGNADTLSTAWTPSTNTWYHLAVTGDGTNMRLFIDGVLKDTQAFSGVGNDAGGLVYIGKMVISDGSPVYLNGWIDEFRISTGIARWIANFTPPPYPYHKIAKIQVS